MTDSRFIVSGPKEERTPIKTPLGQFLVECIREHGDRVALVTEVDGVELSLTYPDILRYASVVARVLKENGLGIGDTAMLCCGNILEFAPILLGTLVLGAACSPVNPAASQGEFSHLLDVIEPKLVFCDYTSRPNMEKAVSLKCSSSTTPVIIPLAELKRRFCDEESSIEEFPPIAIDDLDNHVAMVMTSSGTTGRPKGVEISHACILYIIGKTIMGSGMVGLVASGPYWASGAIINMIFIRGGSKLVLLNKFSEQRFLESIQKYKVNFTSLGSDLVVSLAKWESTEEYDLSSLALFGIHGGRISESMLELAQKRCGKKLTQSFGMTEMWSSLFPPFDRTDKQGSVGNPFTNVDAKIVDVETGLPLGPNCEGEICIRSPARLIGYRGNPEATAALFDEDGFLRTGDVGYYDEDGYFYIMDRIKDLIKYRLIQVPAVEIEEVLLEHPDVLEAAVVGIPHEDDIERSMAFVVKRHRSQVQAADLEKLVEGKLTNSKWLHGGVRFLDLMPRTHTGKVKKRELRSMHLADESLQEGVLK